MRSATTNSFRRIAALRLIPVLFALVACAAGCGQGLHPVHGKVTLPDGKPVPGGMVVFEGQVGGKTISSRGEIAADGSFSMSTNTPGDGVPAGSYKVSVAPPGLANPDARPAPLFADKYSSFDSSGLTFEVKPGKNEFPIQVSK